MARINLYARRWSRVCLIHDEQKQFDLVLERTKDFVESNSRRMKELELVSSVGYYTDWEIAPGKHHLTFSDSKSEPGIQVADVIARVCTQRMNAALADAKPRTSFDEVFEVLGSLGTLGGGVGVNVFATMRDTERFWGSTRGD